MVFQKTHSWPYTISIGPKTLPFRLKPTTSRSHIHPDIMTGHLKIGRISGWIHQTFWLTHCCILMAFVAVHDLDGAEQLVAIAPHYIYMTLIFFISYCILIGFYAHRHARFGILWSLASLILAPFSMWVTYILFLSIKPKEAAESIC